MLTININIEEIKKYLLGAAGIISAVILAVFFVSLMIQIASAAGIVVTIGFTSIVGLIGFICGWWRSYYGE